jgi:hypothetical protein
MAAKERTFSDEDSDDEDVSKVAPSSDGLCSCRLPGSFAARILHAGWLIKSPPLKDSTSSSMKVARIAQSFISDPA